MIMRLTRRLATIVLSLSIPLALAACAATPTPAARQVLADRIADGAGMIRIQLVANGFVLVAYRRLRAPGQPVHVYIEGDGLAWTSRRRLSDDPTPTDPLALRLAARDPALNVVYLARPCQYVAKAARRRCQPDYWSTKRFAEEVIQATDEAVDQVRDQARAPATALIGYSGGGAVAALVAARRRDVASLRTIAAPLDHGAFTAHHGVTPLQGSLNPIDQAGMLSAVPQIHFVGGADTIMPPEIARSFVARVNARGCAVVTLVPEATHFEGWETAWPDLLSRPVTCRR